ncbi:MAG: ATP-binding cassette domain-containing protein, partial [Halanaerobiales bacterium]
MSNAILKLNDINKSFDNLKAVDSISFEVNKGEILGLLGPNGAGKTTAIRMIMGIFQPDSGTIEFDRDSIINKKKIGYL